MLVRLLLLQQLSSTEEELKVKRYDAQTNRWHSKPFRTRWNKSIQHLHRGFSSRTALHIYWATHVTHSCFGAAPGNRATIATPDIRFRSVPTSFQKPVPPDHARIRHQPFGDASIRWWRDRASTFLCFCCPYRDADSVRASWQTSTFPLSNAIFALSSSYLPASLVICR